MLLLPHLTCSSCLLTSLAGHAVSHHHGELRVPGYGPLCHLISHVLLNGHPTPPAGHTMGHLHGELRVPGHGHLHVPHVLWLRAGRYEAEWYAMGKAVLAVCRSCRF